MGGLLGFFLGRRPGPRATATAVDRGVLGGLVVVLFVLVVASGITSIVGRTSVDAAERAGAFAVVEMNDTTFQPDRLEIPHDQAVRLVIENNDLVIHTFTIKDLNVEYAMGGRSEKLADIPAAAPGTYEFTCQVPGHEDMKGTLVVS